MIVINLHRDLPRDIFPSLWDLLEGLISDGRVTMPRAVLIELERVDDDCAPWARSLDGFVRETSQDEIEIVMDITRRHPEWVTADQNEADPWVIAHALTLGAVILTNEGRRGPDVLDRNLRIPNVADEYGATAISFNDFARSEGWSF